MSVQPVRCGIKVEPPSLVLTYVEQNSGKKRQRSMPLRNFTTRSGVTRVADELKKNPRHKKFLEQVQTLQIEKLLRVIQERMKGLTLNDSLSKATAELQIDPEENLNILNDDELNKKKRVMDESFEQNRKKHDDPDFVYNVEVDFEKGSRGIETSGWDSHSDSDF